MRLTLAFMSFMLVVLAADPALAPPAIGAVAAAAGAAIAGAELVSIIASFAITLVLGFISQALAPKPSQKQITPISSALKDRVFDTQDPIASREVVYGEQRKGGNIVFRESTEENKFLHIVALISASEIEGFGEVFLNDDPIHDDDLDGGGNVTAGKYSGKVRIKKHLGASSQVADADLIGIGGWTSAHRLRGIAYLYIRLEFDRDLFPSQVPNISVWVKGKKVAEVRDSAIPTQFSTNPALITRDYLISDADAMGLGFDATNEIDDTFTTSAANICDQIVTTTSLAKTANSVDTTDDWIDFTDDELLTFQTGDKVNVTSTGSVPGGLGAGLFAIPRRRSKAILADDSIHSNIQVQFALTYDNAIAGVAIDITSVGSGTITVTKVGEPRYATNGIIDSSANPISNISDILTSMGGKAIHIGGTWKIFAAGFNSPTVSIDENDLRAGLTVQTKHSRRVRFNAVKGVYISPVNNGVAADYPPITNATYKAEDNGIRIWHDLDLPFVARPHQAQRLAKIELEKHRQQITVAYPAKFTTFQLQPTDVVQVNNTRMGWTDKEFELVEWNVKSEQSGESDVFALVVDLILRETASGIYDWASGDETFVDLAPNTTLPNPFTVGAPTGVGLTTRFFTDITGAQFLSIIVTWSTPTDFYVTHDGKIEIQFKKTLDSIWEPSFFVAGDVVTMAIPMVEDAVNYDVRLRSVNHVGVRSNFNTIASYLVGSTVSGADSVTDYGFVTQTETLFFDWQLITDSVDSADHKDYGTLV